jgi:hypothetical protein
MGTCADDFEREKRSRKIRKMRRRMRMSKKCS